MTIREIVVTVLAWIGGLLLFSAILYGCAINVREGNARSDFIEQCTIDGLRIEQVYDASGWSEDVYCFDSDDRLVREFDGLGTRGNR